MWASILPVALIVGEFLIRLSLVGYILLRREPRSATTLAWIVVILAVPLLGIPGYLLVGEARLGRRRIRRHSEILKRIMRPELHHLVHSGAAKANVPADYVPIATLAEAVGDNGPVGGNSLELMANTEFII